MRSPVTHLVLLAVALSALASESAAQSATQSTAQSAPSAPPLPANDSIFRRARRLVGEGQGAAGRALVDSIVRASAEGTVAHGNALFWRGALSETAADAERDYRRVIVEYPLSPYSDDALLSLAELEQARGDRAAAFQHLQRFVREHPVSPARARAGLAAARLAFEQRDVTGGCAMIADARASVGATDVELRNQIDYHGSRCPAAQAAAPASAAPSTAPPSTATAGTQSRTRTSVTTTVTTSTTPIVSASAGASGGTAAAATSAAPRATPATPAPPATVAPSPSPTAASSAAAPSPVITTPEPPARRTEPRVTPAATAPAAAPPATRGTWTIQLAAYNTRPDAERLVTRLAARGVKARVSGDAKPFRVRLDYYPTHQAAAAAVASLKQRGIIGFVTEEPRSAGATNP